jgi:lysophospholipase L1-like esterase
VGDDLPQQRLATAIGELYSRYLKPHFLHFIRKTDAGDTIAANSDEVMRDNLKNLDSIQELVERQGARLSLVYIPFRRDIPEISRTPASVLKAWSDAHRISMCDLTSIEAQYSSREITLDNGIHLNAKGHEIVARGIERCWAAMAGASEGGRR